MRLSWRVAAGWLLAWYALAIGALLAFGWSIAFVVMVGLSVPTFDLHVLMLDRAAGNRHGLGEGVREAWGMLKARARTYLEAGIWRMCVSSVLLGAWLGALHLLGAPVMLDQRGAAMLPWADWLGVNWMAWSWVGLMPLVWQKHGITSLRSWLARRHGLPADIADQLQYLARRKNPDLMLRLSFLTTGVGFGALIFAPFLLPAFEIYHAAVMRCAWHDLFDGDTRVEAFAPQAQAAQARDFARSAG